MKQIIYFSLLMSSASCYALHADQVPEKAAAAPAEQTEVTEWSLVQGVDTTGDEGRGDWFKKKKIVQQARKVYQDIHAAVEKIAQEHDVATQAYTPQLAELSAWFSTQFTVEPVEIEQKLHDVDSMLEAFTAKEALTDLERKQLLELQDSKNILQQFFEDVTFAYELQQGLQQAVAVAQAQVEQCSVYEHKAWDLHEAIDAALNDTIAEQKLEEMQTIAENIAIISNYLTHDLDEYFKKSTALLKEQEQKVMEQYTVLQMRGMMEKKPTAQELAAEQAKAAQAAAAKVQPSWWEKLLSPFIWLWDWIMSFFRK